MENKTEESIIVTIDDTEGNSRDFVQDMVYCHAQIQDNK